MRTGRGTSSWRRASADANEAPRTLSVCRRPWPIGLLGGSEGFGALLRCREHRRVHFEWMERREFETGKSPNVEPGRTHYVRGGFSVEHSTERSRSSASGSRIERSLGHERIRRTMSFQQAWRLSIRRACRRLRSVSFGISQRARAHRPSTAEPVGDAVRSPLPTVARDADHARQKRHRVPRRGVDPAGVGVAAHPRRQDEVDDRRDREESSPVHHNEYSRLLPVVATPGGGDHR